LLPNRLSLLLFSTWYQSHYTLKLYFLLSNGLFVSAYGANFFSLCFGSFSYCCRESSVFFFSLYFETFPYCCYHATFPCCCYRYHATFPSLAAAIATMQPSLAAAIVNLATMEPSIASIISFSPPENWQI
jgi:hypothetical protein